MIKEKIQKILKELPKGVELAVVAKTRSPQEILEAIEGGAKIIGENYVQEAEKAFDIIGNKVQWHCIGHLQTNKVKNAVRVFDMIETVDSEKIAIEIDKRCKEIGKVMPILVEVNSGGEAQKSGVSINYCSNLLKMISQMGNIKLLGLMTMAPYNEDPEEARPYFKRTKELFDKIAGMNLPNVEMKYLSMGMSGTYKIAIQEGANIVRIGTDIFGKRE